MKFFKGLLWSLLFCIPFWLVVGLANAADPELLIEFSMDPPEAAQYIVEYRLLVTKDSQVGPVLIGTMPVTDTGDMTWTDTFYDIPMGKTLNYYLHSVDADGDIGFSPAFPFKLTGQAIIINIRRIK